MMAREEQQADPDLRDEQCLHEREQMGQEPARLPVAVVRPGADPGGPEGRSEHRERDRMVDAHHGPAELLTASAADTGRTRFVRAARASFRCES